MRKICSMVISCLFICGLLAGCGGSKIVVPFSSNRYQSLQYSDAVKQLEDAGFSNISALDVETDRESDSGRVFSISIDGDAYFSETSQFPADAPIVLKYYTFVSEPVASTPEPDPEPTPIYFADEESLRLLSESLFGFEYSDLSVFYDEIDEAFVVSFLPSAVPPDETAFVQLGINRYINFCRAAYEIDGLDRVRFDISALGTTNKGNEVVFDGLSILMTREDFDTFNWDGLSYMPIWDSFCDNCYLFLIDPVFSQYMDTSKIFYDPFLRDGLIV